jgi:branched-subunit amino acid ABC-type transport system permease component
MSLHTHTTQLVSWSVIAWLTTAQLDQYPSRVFYAFVLLFVVTMDEQICVKVYHAHRSAQVNHVDVRWLLRFVLSLIFRVSWTLLLTKWCCQLISLSIPCYEMVFSVVFMKLLQWISSQMFRRIMRVGVQWETLWLYVTSYLSCLSFLAAVQRTSFGFVLDIML